MSIDVLLTNFAASSSDSDLFGTLGIDWMMLGLQAAAFLVLVAVLGKFVYPVFMRIIDERQEKIEASVKAAEVAQKKAEEAEDHVAEELRTARKEAADIVATAKAEATAAVEAAEAKAKARAERIVQDAQEQIEKDVIKAKKALYNETLELVALATEKVVNKNFAASTDDSVIQAAIKEAK